MRKKAKGKETPGNKGTHLPKETNSQVPISSALVRKMRKSGVRCLHLNLRRAVRTVDRHFDFALQTVGLTANRFNILMTLGANPKGMELARLSMLLVYDRSTVLRNLEPLAEANWICDIPADTKRARKIALTQTGLLKLKEGLEVWNRAQTEAESILGEEDYNLFLKKLRKLASQN